MVDEIVICPKCKNEMTECSGGRICQYCGYDPEDSVMNDTGTKEKGNAMTMRDYDSVDKETLIDWVEEQNAIITKLTPIPVVAAVMKDYLGAYLIAKRKPEQWMGSKWCFAGGKVEPGEEPTEALVREVLEELGIHIIVERLIHTQLEQYDHGVFLLHYFDCTITAGEIPKTIDCAEFTWADAKQLQTYDLLPVDIDIAKRIGLESKLAMADATLRNLEWWIQDNNEDQPEHCYCIVCGGFKEDGHDEDCFVGDYFATHPEKGE